jgi:pyruvate/2-oxoglutarate/acetoin dehydrogenase E1 component
MEQAFYELDAPVGRVCTAEIPLPYPHHLELAAMPSVERIIEAAQRAMRGESGEMAVA